MTASRGGPLRSRAACARAGRACGRCARRRSSKRSGARRAGCRRASSSWRCTSLRSVSRRLSAGLASSLRRSLRVRFSRSLRPLRSCFSRSAPARQAPLDVRELALEGAERGADAVHAFLERSWPVRPWMNLLGWRDGRVRCGSISTPPMPRRVMDVNRSASIYDKSSNKLAISRSSGESRSR